MKERLRRIVSVSPMKIVALVVLTAVVLFFLDPPLLRFLELKTLDLRMAYRGVAPPGGETVIVAIDEKSLNELGRWPWPRKTMASLVDALNAQGAKAIGFDIVFAEPEQDAALQALAAAADDARKLGITDRRLHTLLEERQKTADGDAVLAAALEAAGNVTLGYFFHMTADEVGHLSAAQIAAGEDAIAGSRFPLVRSGKDADPSRMANAYAVQPTIPRLAAAAANSGYFNAFPDSDGVIRWSPLALGFRGNYYPSFALSVLLQYLEWPVLTLEIAPFGAERIGLEKRSTPVDEHGRVLVNYLGPAGTFPHYSAADILAGRVPADRISGKIVLVGATATGIYDVRVTPFNTVYPGIEIHATVIDNILRQNFLIHSGWTRFLDLLVIVAAGLLVGFTIARVRALAGIALGVALLGALVAAHTAIFTTRGVWLNLTYPLLTVVAGYVGITVYRYVTEEREKKKIRGAFQYYLAASVVNEILKDPSRLRLGGDRKNLTVLFSDIRGFTSIAERLTPEELVQLLNEYLTAMTGRIFQHDGLLDKYIGDAVMAVFGAPLHQPDHALRACRSALGMIRELEILQQKWHEEGRPEINIGIGINTGEMVVGNMGSQMRFDYTVMGDSVNLASRLEGANKEYGTSIIISESTHALVRDSLFCRELDLVTVKGRSQPIRIYELIGESADAEPWIEFARRFEAGLLAYRAGDRNRATDAFRSVLEIRPDDGPARLYLARCETLARGTPAGERRGVPAIT